MKRGELWWARFAPPDKTRPVVLVSRDDAYAHREFVVVARVTTRIRGIRAEVALGSDEGLPRACAANCDDLQTVSKRTLLRRAGACSGGRLDELDEALKFALGLD